MKLQMAIVVAPLLLAACSSNPTETPDMAVAVNSVTCGPNTMLAGQQCVIAASACLSGTMFDPATATCKLIVNYGTKVWSSTIGHVWHHMFYKNPAPPDGGSAYTAVGDPLGTVTATITDTEKLFLKLGDPLGLPGGTGQVPVHWYLGPPSSTYTTFDHQITLGEIKSCTASYTIYQNPPDTTQHMYKFVVDIAGCPHDIVFSTWLVISTTDVRADQAIATPLGGLPHSFTVDGTGKGHWERNLDPAKWTKSGAMVNGSAHTAMVGVVPDLTAFPNAHAWVDLVFHNSGQSNGNPGFCEHDATTGNCVTPPSNNIYLPGQFGVDVAATHQGGKQTDTTVTPIPLGMLQPY
jgi:hypothetical protein